MGQVKFNILQATDADFYNILKVIAVSNSCKEIGLLAPTFTFPQSIAQPISHESFTAADSDKVLSSVLAAEGSAMEILALVGGKNRVEIRRNYNHKNPEQSQSPHLTFTFDDQDQTKKPLYPLVLAEIQSAIRPINPSRISSLIDEDTRQHYEARDLSLARLETTQATLLHEFEAIKQQHYSDIDKKREALDVAYQVKTTELVAKHAQLLKEIEQREQDLETERTKLDDRSSTHVRRDLREKLKEVLTKRQTSFSLSKESAYRRRFVFFGYITVLVVLAGIAGTYLYLESKSASDGLGYLQLGRQLAATIGFFITAGYFLRWMHSWAQQHAEEEFRLRQLEVDLDRASWVVEMVFEWDDSKDKPVPEKLIDTLSANLFGESEKVKAASMTPGDAVAKTLAGLPNAAAELHFPGGKLSLDKKSLKQANKQTAQDD